MVYHTLVSIVDSPEAHTIQNMTLERLAESALHIRASYYTIIAGFIVYFYDIFLTLDDEATLLWAKGGRLIKALYLTNRYIPFVGLLLITYANNPIRRKPMSDITCQTTFILAQICQAVEILVATSIFVTRIYTIYHGHILAQRVLIFVLIISHITLLSLMAYSCYIIITTMFYSHTLRFCVGSPKGLTGALYVTPIVIESFIVVMTLIHAFTFGRRQSGEMGQTAAANILRTLYLDGCMYYLIICGLRVATALMFYLAPKSLILLMPYFEYSLTSAVTSRWFLSFRRTLIDTFSTHHESSLTDPPFTGPTISFGRRVSAQDRQPRRTNTFLSSYAPKTSQSLQQDPLPVEIGFSSSMTHELRTLDSHQDDWGKDI